MFVIHSHANLQRHHDHLVERVGRMDLKLLDPDPLPDPPFPGVTNTVLHLEPLTTQAALLIEGRAQSNRALPKGGALPPGAHAKGTRKNRPKPSLPDLPWHPAFSTLCHAACGEAALPESTHIPKAATFPSSSPSATAKIPTFAVGTVVRVQHNTSLFKIHSHAAWSDDDHQTPTFYNLTGPSGHIHRMVPVERLILRADTMGAAAYAGPIQNAGSRRSTGDGM